MSQGAGGGDREARPGTLFPQPLCGPLPDALICLSVPSLECELWGVASGAQWTAGAV